MAKVIKYTLCTLHNMNNGVQEENLSSVTIGWSESNEEIAKNEAHNGRYTIIEDDIEEHFTPTITERIKIIEQFIEKLRAVFPVLTR